MPRPSRTQTLSEEATWRDNLPPLCRHATDWQRNPSRLANLCIQCRRDAGDPIARRMLSRREDSEQDYSRIQPSHPRWTEAEREQAYEHACTHCKSQAGHPCRLPDKGVLHWPHGARRRPPV